MQNLNSNLDKWRNEVFKIYQQRIFHNLSITPKDLKPDFEKEILKHKFLEENQKKQPEVSGLTAFIEEYIALIKSSKNPNTIKAYNSHLRMLKEFELLKFKKTYFIFRCYARFLFDFQRFHE